MSTDPRIQSFLAGTPFAVVGASENRNKYGNKVLRAYMQHKLPVYPVHPTSEKVEGLTAYSDLYALPATVHGISIITPPAITEKIVQAAAELGIKHIWMQPGAESPSAIDYATSREINLIGGDACLLVAIGFHED
ncbi:MAG: CoA-binding protein [Pirellulales bacterium]|nr:CoA-binding protein [Pirellulales bacterium]